MLWLVVNVCAGIVLIAVLAKVWDFLDYSGLWPFVILGAIAVVIASRGGMEAALIWLVMIGGGMALIVAILLVIKACGGFKEDKP